MTSIAGARLMGLRRRRRAFRLGIMKTAMTRPVALYDEDCGFCRWTLAKLLRLDRDGRLLIRERARP